MAAMNSPAPWVEIITHEIKDFFVTLKDKAHYDVFLKTKKQLLFNYLVKSLCGSAKLETFSKKGAMLFELECNKFSQKMYKSLNKIDSTEVGSIDGLNALHQLAFVISSDRTTDGDILWNQKILGEWVISRAEFDALFSKKLI